MADLDPKRLERAAEAGARAQGCCVKWEGGLVPEAAKEAHRLITLAALTAYGVPELHQRITELEADLEASEAETKWHMQATTDACRRGATWKKRAVAAEAENERLTAELSTAQDYGHHLEGEGKELRDENERLRGALVAVRENANNAFRRAAERRQFVSAGWRNVEAIARVALAPREEGQSDAG